MFTDDPFLQLLRDAVVLAVLCWLIVDLVLKLRANIAAGDAAESFHDQWCIRRGEPNIRQRLRHRRRPALAGDPAKLAEFERLIHLRRIGERV